MLDNSQEKSLVILIKSQRIKSKYRSKSNNGSPIHGRGVKGVNQKPKDKGRPPKVRDDSRKRGKCQETSIAKDKSEKYEENPDMQSQSYQRNNDKPESIHPQESHLSVKNQNFSLSVSMNKSQLPSIQENRKNRGYSMNDNNMIKEESKKAPPIP